MKKFLYPGIAALLLLASAALFAQAGRDLVAVAANAKTPSALVGSQAGRSPHFLLFDSQRGFVEALDNPYADAQDAGIRAIDFLASKGAKVVVAESFGSKISAEMKSKGIRPFEFKGTASEAAKKALDILR